MTDNLVCVSGEHCASATDLLNSCGPGEVNRVQTIPEDVCDSYIRRSLCLTATRGRAGAACSAALHTLGYFRSTTLDAAIPRNDEMHA